MLVNRKCFLIFNLILLLIESVLIYLMITSFLTKDLISPYNGNTVKYVKVKASNVIK